MNPVLTQERESLRAPAPSRKPPIRELWGLPLAAYTYEQSLDAVEDLIARGEPAYFITANLNYAMLVNRQPELRRVNRRAAFLVSDGMPFVWLSRFRGVRLPERIAGSAMIFDLCQLSAVKGYRVFLFGAGPGVAEQAAQNLCRLYPGLQIVGCESPHLASMTAEDHEDLAERIRQAQPDILFAALGQPKGEQFLYRHYRSWNVPACVQVGMSLDIAAGRVRRAPAWMQRLCLEMFYRIAQEPKRLTGRYASNALFALKMLAQDAVKSLPSFKRASRD